MALKLRRRCRWSPGAAEGGFTMIETLVALLIITVGLLGLAGMQAIAQQSELESYQRAQAMVLLNDIMDRISTNRKAATCYAITTGASSPYLGTTSGGGYYDPSGFSCPAIATNPAAVARAQADLTTINQQLQGVAEALNAGQVGAMIGARACIGFDATTQTYSVAVAWQGLSQTFSPATWPAGSTPATARNCALNLYGPDTQRRVVWDTLFFAQLT